MPNVSQLDWNYHLGKLLWIYSIKVFSIDVGTCLGRLIWYEPKNLGKVFKIDLFVNFESMSAVTSVARFATLTTENL